MILPGQHAALRPEDPREVGPYRLRARLGRGGMGTVFLGEAADGRRVAVKVINPELAGEPAFRERFHREVTAARQVRRFCTAPVLDAELDRDPLYVVTEFIEGPTLEQAVTERGPLPGSDLEGLAVGVATALSAIHGAGIVHRDLKPANVLLSATGPRVIDFGIARALDAVDGPTRTGQLVGTPSYMPPELLRGEPITPASDVFAWGCVVAFAGTGRPPFAGKSMPETFYRIVHEEPALDGLDPGVLALVTAALDKDPARRPDTQDLLGRLLGTTRPDLADAAHTVQSTWPHDYPQAAYPQPAWQPPDEQRAAHPQPAPAMPTPPPPPPVQPAGTGGSGEVKGRRTGLLLGIGGGVGAVVLAAGLVWALLLSGGGPLADKPPARGHVLLGLDNFDNVGSGWDNSGTLGCGMYQDSGYRLRTRSFSNDQQCRTPDIEKSPNGRYLIDMRVRLEDGPESGQWDAGISLLDDVSKRYDLVLRPDGTARLLLVEQDHGRDIASGQVPGFEIGRFLHFTATLDLTDFAGPTICLWIDNKKVLEHQETATPLKEGSTSLIVNRPYTSDNSKEARALFDDFGVWSYGDADETSD